MKRESERYVAQRKAKRHVRIQEPNEPRADEKRVSMRDGKEQGKGKERTKKRMEKGNKDNKDGMVMPPTEGQNGRRRLLHNHGLQTSMTLTRHSEVTMGRGNARFNQFPITHHTATTFLPNSFIFYISSNTEDREV